MTDSIRDQLKKLGFKASPTPPKPAKPKPGRGKPGNSGRKPRTRSSEEMDLARAYAIRAQKEKQDRIDAEREKQEQARIRREARQRLEKLLEGDGRLLNDDKAEHARHFEYGGKIRRVYVTPEQLTELNAGRLGVLQMRGRYLLVSAATLAEAEAIFPDAVALKVDPDAQVVDEYADPQYQVPDDLVW